jgi:polyisoprenoid-binding protein YceI
MPTLRLSLFFLLLLTVTTGCFALRQAEEASGPVAAPTLAPAPTPTTAAPAALPATAEPATPEPIESAETATPEPVESAETATPEPAESAEIPAPAANLWTIDPARSEVRFLIDEVLRGSDFTVVGTTRNLGGQIEFDPANPAAARVGQIVINARDFVTDNDFRNNAIRNRVLRSDQFEVITFTPTALEGLPTAITPGERYPFRITGDLTITDQTRPVTFEATVGWISADNLLQGSATAEIAWADWGLTIPFSSQVSAVADTLTLALDFIATAP